MSTSGLWSQLVYGNKLRPANCALSFCGVTITYSELFSKIERVARAFQAFGVSAGDIITLPLPTSPESIICFYALNRIGAIPSMIDVRFRADKVMEIANNTHSKLLLIMSLNVEDIKPVAKKLEARQIIVLSGRESLPDEEGTVLAAGKSSDKFVLWEDFLFMGLSVPCTYLCRRLCRLQSFPSSV